MNFANPPIHAHQWKNLSLCYMNNIASFTCIFVIPHCVDWLEINMIKTSSSPMYQEKPSFKYEAKLRISLIIQKKSFARIFKYLIINVKLLFLGHTFNVNNWLLNNKLFSLIFVALKPINFIETILFGVPF
jgi:hypothetical protein